LFIAINSLLPSLACGLSIVSLLLSLTAFPV
jgi:hypothetical protein